ncbi:hypothetical protein SBOR_8624 [Sclerotinia borealis F-4128]|uniref:G2/M phase checkpoint control protein Sum2 n=1 Tax=Sclerotinia borealis (strain F-4128) TaxID=1432307 RepID=W9C8V6_SCLBF|nr:hypothetical protein SBOR_8624 [Sclerotinia borealis F-4128]
MSEFIGYVGTLHEINSENSTVALENVKSHGTEGRKENPDDEIQPSDSVYEYIVFRGSDVKDLRIEEAPAPKENKPPQVPNDPAILGSGTRPGPSAQAPPAPQNQNQNPRGPPSQGQNGPQQVPPPGMAPFGQYPPHGFYPPPPPAGWGRGGPPGPGFPGMSPFGGPPGWYPPPGHGFPQHPGQFPPPPGYGFPPPAQHFQQQNQQQNQQQKPSPIGPGANKQQTPTSATSADKPTEAQAPGAESTAAPPAPRQATPPSSKTASTEADANAAKISQSAAPPAVRATPSGPKGGRVQPVMPLPSPAVSKAALQNTTAPAPPKQSDASTSLRDATQAATAAVAAAMAKLPPVGSQQTNGNAVDNLTRKVNEMRTTEPVRAPRQPGTNGFAARGRGRGGRALGPAKVDVPSTDFDFESANAKFNKQDLVKESITGSPLGEQPQNDSSAPEGDKEEAVPKAYNKATSFFDNISSEAKDRTEAAGNRPGGREWRGEEQKKNVETFGQGSVDNGHRGAYRGRGRGRGGYRGRGSYAGNGQPTRGRGGGYRGRGDAESVVQ